jgi:flagellar biosynthesis repressor protein FlbT
MPLTINLKAGEKLIVNGVVLQNQSHAARLLVHNEAAVLREKDIIIEDAANTPARRIYFSIQCRYLFPGKSDLYLPMIHGFLRDFGDAVPSALPLLEKIRQEVGEGQFYAALKTTRQLIAKEQEVLNGGTTKIRTDASAG